MFTGKMDYYSRMRKGAGASVSPEGPHRMQKERKVIMRSMLLRYVVAMFFFVAFFVVAPVAGSAQTATSTPPPTVVEKKSGQDVKKEVAEAVKAIGGYSADQRDKAVQAAEKALEMTDARLEGIAKDIQTKSKLMSAAARA